MSRLPNALKLQIHALTMECDNRQTICLPAKEAAKPQTKLGAMSISTTIVKKGGPERDGPISMARDEEMMTDRSTKPLKCHRFIELLGLENIKERLELIRRYDMRGHLAKQENVVAFTLQVKSVALPI